MKRATSYMVGFLLSIFFTILAYIPVTIHMSSHHETFSHEFLIPFVLIIAVVQLIVQLFFFLHLGRDKSSRWNIAMLVSTVSIVIIIVVGSVWIMSNLNYKMTTKQIEQYVQSQDGF